MSGYACNLYMPVKKIALALREAFVSVRNIVLLTALLDTLLMYILLLLGCILLTLPSWYSLFPTLIYAVIHIPSVLREVSYSNIEKKVPELKEQLITVADNWKEDNEIVNALCDDVVQSMKSVKTSYFVDFGKLTRQVGLLAILSFIIIGISAFNVRFIDFTATVQELAKLRSAGDYDIHEELLDFEEGSNLDDILGEENIAVLGNDLLDLELNPIQSEVDIGQIKAPSDEAFRRIPPSEIKASADAGYEDSIPRQYQSIVKTYFREITKS